MPSDLFASQSASDPKQKYDASDIEVLEGLEPVRRRPGMYIGGTDERALHHLVGEILDNAMDEAVAGHADRIEIAVQDNNQIVITDNGRGIPVDEHPKFPGKSALEVILTTLHSGGKFGGKAYQTSGGLHGVGISVVNALSEELSVEVARDKKLYRQHFKQGRPDGPLKNAGTVSNRRGTTVTFRPDPEIFGKKARFRPDWLYRMARSKAYLFSGVRIRWSCAEGLLNEESDIPAEDELHFPGGLKDFLQISLKDRKLIVENAFTGKADMPDGKGRVEFAVTWPQDGEGFCYSYCNTIPTPQGGTHEMGLRSVLSRGIRNYAEMVGNKKASIITADDVMNGASAMLSVFIRDPQFQGQTKEKLASADVNRWVDNAIKDHFDLWLSKDPAAANQLVEVLIQRAEERQRRRDERAMARKSATRKLRLPGKLADCSRQSADNTELFIVEGDSAGGSAKQARNRETQAILPLRGKILNVVSASKDKIRNNTEIQDLIQALGCGIGPDCTTDALRYERIIIMTDADVDGAHIASLLITFFYSYMKPILTEGRLYLSMPPLYRLAAGKLTEYARDDAHKDELMSSVFKGKKVEISRFKGLGEMPAAQLKETTMNPDTRQLLRVTLPGGLETLGIEDENDSENLSARDMADIDDLVSRLMGKNAESRFQFIQENAAFAENLDV